LKEGIGCFLHNYRPIYFPQKYAGNFKNYNFDPFYNITPQHDLFEKDDPMNALERG